MDPSERTPLMAAGVERNRTTAQPQTADPESSPSFDTPYLASEATPGERLAYNDYTTIDWLHELVKASYHQRIIHAHPSAIRNKLTALWDSLQGWLVVAAIGVITACIAWFVDVAVVTVSGWKYGFCTTNILLNKHSCCAGSTEVSSLILRTSQTCEAWHDWTNGYWSRFAVYVALASAFGAVAASVTMTTKIILPSTAAGQGTDFANESKAKSPSSTTLSEHGQQVDANGSVDVSSPIAATPSAVSYSQPQGKQMYAAAGSGIPEIKTILSGFVITDFLTLKVLVVKAIGSIFAVSTGLCLGKEGPFVHISTCVAALVAERFPKYRDNAGKLREILSAGCAAGLSVAFGAPIGGVLFAYEEISTYFPKKSLYRAFICSLFAAMTLRELNPTGNGKLVLFETNYGTTYRPEHYLIFVLLGIAGGIFGGIFCKTNFLWSRTFRQIKIIKGHPVLEVCLVTLATALIQYPNVLTREPGDEVLKKLLVDCNDQSELAYVCLHENESGMDLPFLGWLIHGTLTKLVLTILTFGIKVPLGVIIPSLDAGAFFGRLVGQAPFLMHNISPGIFAMVGAAAFLAGVSRMTISLAVIMFELTGELEFIVPNMIGIMTAKWVADALEKEGVYDLAQTVLGHPFLDLEQSMKLVAQKQHVVNELIPPQQTMDEITVEVSQSGHIRQNVLVKKLERLRARGLMDAGLVLVRQKLLIGYLSQTEVQCIVNEFTSTDASVRQMEEIDLRVCEAQSSSQRRSSAAEHSLYIGNMVDSTPLTINAESPMEYAVEMFGKLGLRYLIVTSSESGQVVGVILKKRLVKWLDGLKHE